MSLAARLVLALALVAAGAAAWWRLTAHYERIGYDRRAAEDAAAMQAQAERNRDLQRAAELRYTVQGEVRDRFITQTVTEIRHVTENLAACAVDPAAVRLLNAAAECARQDRPAACGADLPVPESGAAR